MDTLGRTLGRADQSDLADMTDLAGGLQEFAVTRDIAVLVLADSPWERVGGLGMLLMRRLTDSMTYRRLPDGGNELTLVKVCPAV